MRTVLLLLCLFTVLSACNRLNRLKTVGEKLRTGAVCVSPLNCENDKTVVRTEPGGTAAHEKEISTPSMLTGWETKMSIW